MRIAYLCNLYPAVSHSFVRREINCVEAAGHYVHRFSLRPARNDLRDEADLREAGRTESVLAQGPGRLVGSVIALSLSKPTRAFAALSVAWRLSAPGLKSKMRNIAYWLEAAWLARRFDQLGVQHLHAHFGTNPAAVAAIVRAWGGVPFSFTVHGPDEFDAPLTLKLAAKIRAASFVAAISDYGRSQLMRWTPPHEWQKIVVVRCGVDASFLDSVAQPVPTGSREFLCVARLSPQKGLPLLIAACERLRLTGEAFTLTIIGDGEMRAELDADIRQRRLEECVTLAGVCSSAEIREHLLRARAFVLPSFAEGLPVVIMEALALGRPVITTTVAGIPELVDDQCGWVVPAGTEEGLVDAMRKALAATTQELTSKGEIGRERVRIAHDATKNAQRLLEIITRATRIL